MNMIPNRIIWSVLVLSISLILAGSASTEKTHDVYTPITVDLNISKIPVIGENASLSCRVISIFDAPNTTAEISLPEGAKLLEGNLSDNWDLVANVPVYLNVTVSFDKPGDYSIEARAIHVLDPENSWGDIDALYLTIGAEESLFTPGPSYMYKAEQAVHGEGIPVPEIRPKMPIIEMDVPTTAEDLPTEKILTNATNSADENDSSQTLGSLTITGKWGYYTKLDDYRDVADTLVPAKYFLVEIQDGNGNHLGWGYTDENGEYEITVTNPGSVGVRSIMWTYIMINTPELPELRVVFQGTTLTGLTDVYWWYTETYQYPDGTYSIGEWYAPSDSPNLGACWLLDDLIRTWAFLYSNGGGDGGQGTILWYPTSTDGTYYICGGQIHLEGVDKKSSDTAIHEYGHNVMWNVYGNWFPTTYCPSPHYIELSSHVNCAWTEGWANFLPLTVNGNPIYTWASGSNLNLETPTWGTPSYWDSGPSVEGRVAGALWDIYDTTNDGADIYSYGFNEIEDLVFTQWDNNFNEFWSAWMDNSYSENAAKCLYQNTIDFRSFESGLFRPSTHRWYFNYDNAGGSEYNFVWGDSTDIPVVGDWNCNGKDTAGLFRPSTRRWYFNYDNAGGSEYNFVWGDSTDIPVVGDWNRNGKDTAGLFRPSTRRWYFNYDNAGGSEYSFVWGDSTDVPVVGDWNGDGKDTAGLFRPSTRRWYFNYDNAGGSEYNFVWGDSTDIPVVGDWDHDGKDEVGLYRPSTQRWYFNYDNAGGSEYNFVWGDSTDKPVAGSW